LKHANGLREEERRAKASEIREALNDKRRGLGRAYAKLRNGAAKPIGFLVDPSGRITAHPTEVDKIVQQAWAPVYRGQGLDHCQVAGDFLAKYRDLVFREEPLPVSDITGERLRRELKHSAATAASWDQWEHR
ncbi:MAG: hypothetical protein ACKPKO_58290, partial [Candidatus Fonsibacter sp.]